jgi:hypothetical protein
MERRRYERQVPSVQLRDCLGGRTEGCGQRVQLWPCTARASSIVNPEATMRLIMVCIPRG